MRILTYNTAMVPQPFADHNRERALAFVRHIAAGGFDIVCLQEVFDEDARAIFVAGLHGVFPAIVAKADGPDPLKQDSGLFLAAAWPIRYVRFVPFADRVLFSGDFFANKGVLVVKLELPGGKLLQVCTAHLQSNIGHDAVRAKQLAAIRRAMVSALRGCHDSVRMALVLTGDFNIVGDLPGEYTAMLTALDDPRDLYREMHPRQTHGDNGFTWDATRNVLIQEHNRKDTERQRLDYICAFDRVPTQRASARRQLAKVNVSQIAITCFKNGAEDVSDHFGLTADIDLRWAG